MRPKNHSRKVQECGSAPSFVLGRPSTLFISRGPARICKRRTHTLYPTELCSEAEVAAPRRNTCRNLHVAPERDERTPPPLPPMTCGNGRMSDARYGSTLGRGEGSEKAKILVELRRPWMVCMRFSHKLPAINMMVCLFPLCVTPWDSAPTEHCRHLAYIGFRFDPCKSLSRARWAWLYDIVAHGVGCRLLLLFPPPCTERLCLNSANGAIACSLLTWTFSLLSVQFTRPRVANRPTS